MKHIIPISVVFVIVAITALILVKETNRSGDGTEPTVVQNALKTNTSAAKDPSQLTQTLITTAAKALVKVPNALPNNLGDAIVQEEGEEEAYYPESMNSFGSLNYQNVLQEYYGADILESFDFSDDNPQWRTLADSTIRTFASEALGKELSDNKVDHLRGVFTDFINRHLAEAFATVNGQPKTAEELDALKDKVLKEFDQIMKDELDADIRDFLSSLDPDVAQEILESLDS